MHHKRKTITTTTTVLLVPGIGGVEKELFQQSASAHSVVGEKETININVVGAKHKIAIILTINRFLYTYRYNFTLL